MVMEKEGGPKGSIAFLVVSLLVMSASIPLLMLSTQNAAGTVLFVGQGSTYSKIGYALENATTGDIIMIGPGTYNESVSITVSGITIASNDSVKTIIDPTMNFPAVAAISPNITISGITIGRGGLVVSGNNFSGNHLVLNASISTAAFVDGVSNVSFYNLTIVEPDYNGMEIRSSTGINISKVTVFGSNSYVISILNSRDVRITDSVLTLNSSSTGIKTVNVDDIKIKRVVFSTLNEGNFGTSMENCTNVRLDSCSFSVEGNGTLMRGTRNIMMTGNVIDVKDQKSNGTIFDSCSNITISLDNYNIRNGTYGIATLLASGININNCSFQISGQDSTGILFQATNDVHIRDINGMIRERRGTFLSGYYLSDMRLSSSLFSMIYPGSITIALSESDNVTIDHNMFSSTARYTTSITSSENTSDLSILWNSFYTSNQHSKGAYLSDTADVLFDNNTLYATGNLSYGYLVEDCTNTTITSEDIDVSAPGCIGIQVEGDRFKITDSLFGISGAGSIGIYIPGSSNGMIGLNRLNVIGTLSSGMIISGTGSNVDINSTIIEASTTSGIAIASTNPSGKLVFNNVQINSSINDQASAWLREGSVEVNGLSISSPTFGALFEDMEDSWIADSNITGAVIGLQLVDCNLSVLDSHISSIDVLYTSNVTALDTNISGQIFVSEDSRLEIFNTISILVLDKEMEPFAGVDIKIDGWDEVFYATDHFDSSDPETNINGTIPAMIFLDRIYEMSPFPTLDQTNLTVYAKGNSVMIWDETFAIDTSYPHTKVMICPDIDLPGTPINFTIRQVDTKESLFLNWDPNNDDTIEYWIYQLDPDTTEQGLVDKVPFNQTSWTSPELGPSKKMFHWVTSWDGIWESSPSALVSGTTKDLTAPLPPQDLSSMDQTKDSITMIWSHDRSEDLAGFIIYMSEPSSVDFDPIDTIGPELRIYTATGLEWGTLYRFRVQAFDTSDNHSPLGGVLSVSTLIPVFEIIVQVYYGEEGPLAERPADGVTLELLAFNGTMVVATKANETGMGSFSPYAAYESYSVRAVPKAHDLGEMGFRTGYLPATSQLVTTDPDNETIEIELTLEYYIRIVNGTIKVKVVFGDGPRSGPVFGANVELVHESENIIDQGSTNADGIITFIVSDLPLRGRFHITPPEGMEGDVTGQNSGYLVITTNFFELTQDDPDQDMGEVALNYYTYIPPPEYLLILSASPHGTAVDLVSPIIITFNQPVDTRSVRLALQITPSLKDEVFIWENANRTLRIEHLDLVPETEYTITFGPGARSEEGTSFPSSYTNNTFSFKTTALPDSDSPDDHSKYIMYAIAIGTIVILIIVLIYSRIKSRKEEDDEYTRPYSPYGEYDDSDYEEEEEFYDEDYPDDIAEQMEDELPYDDDEEYDDEDDDVFEETEELEDLEDTEKEFSDVEEELEYEEEEEPVDGFLYDEGMEEDEVEEPIEEPKPKKKKKRKKSK